MDWSFEEFRCEFEWVGGAESTVQVARGVLRKGWISD